MIATPSTSNGAELAEQQVPPPCPSQSTTTTIPSPDEVPISSPSIPRRSSCGCGPRFYRWWISIFQKARRRHHRPSSSSSSFSLPPPGIVALLGSSLLMALSLGSIVGVFPDVVSDRYARLYHHYDNPISCGSSLYYNNSTDTTTINDLLPIPCQEGYDQAQMASAWSSVIQNILTFICNPIIGSWSDSSSIGRKPMLIGSLGLSTISPIILIILQYYESFNPIWYYITISFMGIINYISIAFAAISDLVLLPNDRTSSFALLMASFYGGFAISPTLATILFNNNHLQVSIVSCILQILSLLTIIVFFPESLPSLAVVVVEEQQQQEHQQHLQGHEQEQPYCCYCCGDGEGDEQSRLECYNNGVPPNDEEYNGKENLLDRQPENVMRVPLLLPSTTTDNITTLSQLPSPPSPSMTTTTNNFYHKWTQILIVPIQEISILNSTSQLRFIAGSSFFMSMVFSGDRNLLLYYWQDQLDIHGNDLAQLFLFMGLLGTIIQAIVLPFIMSRRGQQQQQLEIIGAVSTNEIYLLRFSFLAGIVSNILYGTAAAPAVVQHHSTSQIIIYIAVGMEQLSRMNYPLLASCASHETSPHEQGQVQGALAALQAVGAAIGPLSMQYVYDQTTTTKNTGSSSFIWGGGGGPGTMFYYAAFLYGIGTVFVYLIQSKVEEQLVVVDEETNNDLETFYSCVADNNNDDEQQQQHTPRTGDGWSILGRSISNSIRIYSSEEEQWHAAVMDLKEPLLPIEPATPTLAAPDQG